MNEANTSPPPLSVGSNDLLAVTPPRVVCQFSCGAASAVATKLALQKYGDRCVIVNAYVKQEHEDNRRFLADCERWFGRSVTVLRDERYGADIIRVFRERGYMKGMAGAPCTLHHEPEAQTAGQMEAAGRRDGVWLHRRRSRPVGRLPRPLPRSAGASAAD